MPLRAGCMCTFMACLAASSSLCVRSDSSSAATSWAISASLMSAPYAPRSAPYAPRSGAPAALRNMHSLPYTDVLVATGPCRCPEHTCLVHAVQTSSALSAAVHLCLASCRLAIFCASRLIYSREG